MESIRSYGRISWQHNMPVFHMVNPSFQRFTLLPQAISNLMSKKGKIIRIKNPTRNPAQDQEGYLGEIWGVLDAFDYDTSHMFKITLYIAEPTGKLSRSNQGVLGWIEQHEYYFPKKELTGYFASIEFMHSQTPQYMTLMMDADVVPVTL